MAAQAADWLQLQANAAKTGVNASERLVQLEPAFSLDVLGAGTDTQVNLAGPVVLGDTVYIGTNAGWIMAVSRQTGTVNWSTYSDAAIRATPAVTPEVVVVPGTDGFLGAFALGDGTGLWWHDAQAPVVTAPTLAVIAGERRVYIGGADGTVQCIRVSDGTRIWTASTGAAVWAAPTVDESRGRVYVASYDQRLYALDASTGNVIWVTNPQEIRLGPMRAAVALRGTRLYVPTLQHGLVVVDDPLGGAVPVERWRLETTGTHTGSAAVVDRPGLLPSIYVANDRGEVQRIDDAGGFGEWQWTKSVSPRPITASVVCADGKVIVATETGKIVALNGDTGEQLLTAQASEGITGSPAVARGHVFVIDALGNLSSFGNTLEPPTGLTAVAQGNMQVGLSWAPVILQPSNQPVSGYQLYRAPSPEAALVSIGYINGVILDDRGNPTAASTYADSTLTAPGLYYYAVTSMQDLAGTSPGLEESSFSDLASVVVAAPSASPMLASALSMTPGLVEPGMRIVVALTVTNTGTEAVGSIAGVIDVNTGGTRVSLVSGPSGTLSLAPGESGVLAWTYSVVGSGTVKFTATASGQGAVTGMSVETHTSRSFTIRTPASLTASLALAPSPAVVGGWVTVTLTVHNPGGISATAVQPSLGLTGATAIVEPISGPVPDFSVTLDGGSQVFVWTYSVNGVGTVGFSVTVTGLDTLTGVAIQDTAFKNLTTKAPTTLVSALSMTPGLVEPGMQIVVSLTVTNTGGMDAEDVVGTIDVNTGGSRVSLVSGPSGPLTLGPGESGVFTWTFSTTGSGAVKFTATATGEGDGTGYPVSTTDTHSYTIKTPASLTGSLDISPSPAVVGQWVTVTLTVHDPGGISATAVEPSLGLTGATGLVEYVSGPIPAFSVTLDGGSQTFVWTYSADGVGTVGFSVTVTGLDTLTGAALEDREFKNLVINVPTTLDSVLSMTPGLVEPGQVIVIALTVTNTGGMDAENVMGTLDVNTGGSRVSLVSGPSAPRTLGAGQSGVLAWTFSTTGSGTVKVTATATGQAAGTGYPVSTHDTHSYTIKTAASLSAVLAFSPSPASVGQWVTVTLTVHDSGGIGATAVVASVSPVTGMSLVQAIDGPTPAYSVTIDGGGVQVFTWTWSVTGAGKIKFSATAWGEDILSGVQIRDTAVKTLTTSGGSQEFSARGRAPGEHKRPVDVAVDLEGYVWIVDSGNWRVEKYTADADFLFEVGVHATGGKDSGTGFQDPVAAAVDGLNRVWVLDRLAGDIKAFDRDGKLVARIGTAARLHEPEGLCVDASGHLWVADTLNNRVVEMDAAGNVLTVFGTAGNLPGQLQHPTGVAVEPGSGNLLVTDQQNHRVQVFTPAGAFVETFGDQGSSPGQFQHPWEAVADTAGDLFVSDTGNDRVAWDTLDGIQVLPVGSLPGTILPGLSLKQPHGIAVDRDATRLYVVDTGNSRVIGIDIGQAADTLPPRAVISAPAAGATVTGVVPVRGIAADAHFANYELEYGLGSSPSSYALVTRSTDPVWNGELGLWDTTGLSGGVYTLRLTVVDGSGNRSTVTTPVTVQGAAAPLIVSASALPASFMTDQAGPRLAYNLATAATVTVAILPPNSNHPIWMAEATSNGYGGMAGPNTMAWNGRNDTGQPVAPGLYVALLMARAGSRVDRRTIPLLAVPSPESQAALLAGPGSGNAATPPQAGSAAIPATGAAVATVSGGSSPASSSSAAGSAAAASTGTTGDPHDNGWHNGNNPNGFTIDHSDKSNGQGNNHH